MKTIQMTIDDPLLDNVDKMRRKLKKTRSEFIREALKNMLTGLRIKEMELQHKKGYQRKPVKPNEFDLWHDEQAWIS
jgi:metal-responsive CopG/Arc/MetJ family transcriptional regulator